MCSERVKAFPTDDQFFNRSHCVLAAWCNRGNQRKRREADWFLLLLHFLTQEGEEGGETPNQSCTWQNRRDQIDLHLLTGKHEHIDPISVHAFPINTV